MAGTATVGSAGVAGGGPLTGEPSAPPGGGGSMPPVSNAMATESPRANYVSIAPRPPYTGTPSSTHVPWSTVAPVLSRPNAIAYYGAV